MDRDLLYVLLWMDGDEPQCAVYEDHAQAKADALVVGGRVVARPVFALERERTGRFDRS